jgi:uncharacterized protein (TIGR03435 family)
MVSSALNSSLNRFLIALAFVALTPNSGFAQTAVPSAANKQLEWDVISVKTVKSMPDGMLSHTTGAPDGFSIIMPLGQFVAAAYGIRQDLISGLPGWANSTEFAIDAKVAPSDVEQFRTLAPQQRGEMLQSILVERFKFSAHMVTRQLPAYELVLTKRALLQQARPRLIHGPRHAHL